MGPVVRTKAGLSPTFTENTGEALEPGCGSGFTNVDLRGDCVGGCCTVTAGLVVFAPWAVFAVPEAGWLADSCDKGRCVDERLDVSGGIGPALVEDTASALT